MEPLPVTVALNTIGVPEQMEPVVGVMLTLMPGTGVALAELGQRGRNMLWYSPRWQAAGIRADDDASGEAWARLLHDNRISHVILKPNTLTAAQHAGMQRSGATLVETAGDAQWWRIPDNTHP